MSETPIGVLDQIVRQQERISQLDSELAEAKQSAENMAADRLKMEADRNEWRAAAEWLAECVQGVSDEDIQAIAAFEKLKVEK